MDNRTMATDGVETVARGLVEKWWNDPLDTHWHGHVFKIEKDGHEYNVIDATGRAWLESAIADAIRVAVAREREANCRAVCEGCRLGSPTTVDDDGTWHMLRLSHHYSNDQLCGATAIRQRGRGGE